MQNCKKEAFDLYKQTKGLEVVKEKSGKAKKVKFYKGQPVMSDTEDMLKKD